MKCVKIMKICKIKNPTLNFPLSSFRGSIRNDNDLSSNDFKYFLLFKKIHWHIFFLLAFEVQIILTKNRQNHEYLQIILYCCSLRNNYKELKFWCIQAIQLPFSPTTGNYILILSETMNEVIIFEVFFCMSRPELELVYRILNFKVTLLKLFVTICVHNACIGIRSSYYSVFKFRNTIMKMTQSAAKSQSFGFHNLTYQPYKNRQEIRLQGHSFVRKKKKFKNDRNVWLP
ncbi:hypothetical protein AGLY_012630 [Aphis glycines]|uniref:Uncharacterized protein n=1 Tax=Aphis glycines TaxID=307491 RepID=A0A6G0TB31_APHGL|nr:hypothetical protein AGLY_012630 [Aphis glycines]